MNCLAKSSLSSVHVSALCLSVSQCPWEEGGRKGEEGRGGEGEEVGGREGRGKEGGDRFLYDRAGHYTSAFTFTSELFMMLYGATDAEILHSCT